MTCTRCQGPTKKLYNGLCADCERTRVRSLPIQATACDRCGERPAYRNPSHRRNEYLCVNCHSVPLRFGSHG